MFVEGNTYKLKIKLKNKLGEIIDINAISKVEFVIGNITKIYGEDEDVIYDEDSKSFIIELGQQNTFDFEEVIEIQARIKFNINDIVKASKRYTYYVGNTISQEII